MKAIDEFTTSGSGWGFESCKKAEGNVLTYKPFRGSSYIKTPTLYQLEASLMYKIRIINALSGQYYQCYIQLSIILNE